MRNKDSLLPTDNSEVESEIKPVRTTGFQSLQFKASFLVVLLILAVAVTSMILSLRTMSSVLYETKIHQAREWAIALASNASNAYVNKDIDSLKDTTQELIKTLDVAYVLFVDVDGEVLASAEIAPGLAKNGRMPVKATDENSPGIPAKIIRHDTLDHTYVDVVVPVYGLNRIPAVTNFSPPVIGYLRFGTDLSNTQKELHKLGRKMSHTTIVILLIAIPCCFLATRQVIAPLQILARTARAIANGSMDARADIKRRNEIGELAESFNVMASRVAISQMELLELNAELEKRVQQRTRELEELAARDPLTGLYNRRHFSEQIAREFAAAERYDADMSCLMFDLDRFKKINDQFGHRTGDELLMLLTRAISSELREADVAARFGGDEFILLLPQTSAPAALTLAQRIVKRFNTDLAVKFPETHTTLSGGIASLRTTQAESAEALINEADMAMYAAKESGRNCIMDADKVPAHSKTE